MVDRTGRRGYGPYRDKDEALAQIGAKTRYVLGAFMSPYEAAVLAALAEVGISASQYERDVLGDIACQWDPDVAQVVIGLLWRAYEAGAAGTGPGGRRPAGVEAEDDAAIGAENVYVDLVWNVLPVLVDGTASTTALRADVIAIGDRLDRVDLGYASAAARTLVDDAADALVEGLADRERAITALTDLAGVLGEFVTTTRLDW